MKNRIDQAKKRESSKFFFGDIKATFDTHTYKHSAMKKLDCEHISGWIVFILLRIAYELYEEEKNRIWYAPLLYSQASI